MRVEQRAFLVCYDISDPKRLRLVHKAMRGFGQWVQYSVFLCVLSAMRVVELRARLEEEIAAGEDQVLIVPLGSVDRGKMKEIIAVGRPLELPTGDARVF